jgi:plasmid stabilization system protein ParE
VRADLFVLRRAQNDLEEIQRYLVRASPDAGPATFEGLLDALERLRGFPRSGARPIDPRLRGLGFRVLVAERYLIFYKETPTRVKVNRVHHQRRAWDRLL